MVLWSGQEASFCGKIARRRKKKSDGVSREPTRKINASEHVTLCHSFFSSTSTVRVLTPRQNFSFSVVSQGTGSAAKAAISRPHRSRFQRRLFRFFFSRVVIRPFLPPKRPSSSGIASRLHELVIASLSWANHRQLLSQLPCNDPERQVGGGRWVI
jgi:hypothetical protein